MRPQRAEIRGGRAWLPWPDRVVVAARMLGLALSMILSTAMLVGHAQAIIVAWKCARIALQRLTDGHGPP